MLASIWIGIAQPERTTLMHAIYFYLFLKRLCWRIKLHGKSEDELLAMLRTPDRDIVGLVWRSYLRKVNDISQLMAIVADSGDEFPRGVRRAAGRAALTALKNPWQDHLLRHAEWWSPTVGRLSYLIVIGYALHELRDRIRAVVENYLHPDEQLLFAHTCPWLTR